MKTMKDFENHWDAYDDIDNVETGSVVEVLLLIYDDYIIGESTNLDNIRNGEPMEYEAEAYEAKYAIKDTANILANRKDSLKVLTEIVENDKNKIAELKRIAKYYSKALAAKIEEAEEDEWL